MYKRGFPCRCSSCGTRQTFRLRPDLYVRPRRCRCCGLRRFRVDWWRLRHEHEHYRCTCHAFGRYTFQHRRGSKWCIFSTSPPKPDEFRAQLGGEYELTPDELGVWLSEQRALAMGEPADELGEIPF